MQSMSEAAADTGPHNGLIADERGDSSLAYAVIMGLMIGGVVVGASFFDLATPKTREQPALSSTAPQTFATLGDPRLWFQCGAIVVGFGLYYLLWRRAALLEQEELEALDIRTGTQEEVEAKLCAKRQDILAALAKNPDRLANGQLSVRHVMTTRLITVTPRATIDEARQTMADNKLRHLVVCQDDRLLGVISDRDLAKPGRCAAHIMARKPVTVEAETAISPAVTTMMHKRISCLPVVEGERLVGLFTTTDLVMTLQCAFQLLQFATEHLPSPATPAPRRETSQSAAVTAKA